MVHLSARHDRRSIRLRHFDYASAGAYFVTIVTHRRARLFGTIASGRMRLSGHGEIALRCWRAIPDHFPRVRTDAMVVMPDHVHGVVWIVGGDDDEMDVDAGAGDVVGGDHVGAQHAAPLRLPRPRHPGGLGALRADRPCHPRVIPGSVGAIVRSYKSAVTRGIRAMNGGDDARVWQRNYHEHIIRDVVALRAIRCYIETNPSRWAEKGGR